MNDDAVREILARELYVMQRASIDKAASERNVRGNWYVKISDLSRDVWRKRAETLIESLASSGIAVKS